MTELDRSMTGVVLACKPGPSFERRGEPPRILRALRSRLGGTWTGISYIFLVSLLLMIPGLLVPSLSRLFVDHVLFWGEATWVKPLLLAMFANLTILAVLHWLQRRFLLSFQTHVAVEGSRRFFWHLLHLPIEFYRQRFTGDISSRVALNDRLAELLSGDLAVSALSFLVLVFYAAVMVQYDAILTTVSVVVASTNLLVLRWVSRQRSDGNKHLLREQNLLGSIALWGLETIETLKASSSEGDLFARWSGQQARVINLRQNLELANQPVEMLPTLLTAMNAALILGVGGLRVMQGRLSLGSLLAFQILTFAFTAPVNRLVSLGRRLQIAEGEIGLLDDVLRASPVALESATTRAALSTVTTAKLSGHLELQGITFGYSPLDPPVVKQIELTLRPGDCAAIVGQTGSGKSTIANLVSGLYEPWEGRILFDSHQRSELPRSLWMNSVSVVDQDIFIFEGTVRENLQLWNDQIPEDCLVAAARDACILDDIMTRGGFDEEVDEGGANWSGGQLQRLEIARALAANPKLLILDEATSSLDPQTEAQIVRNIRRRGCACLLIAHRLSTIRDADEIVVLANGEIIQRGTHSALLAADGLYSTLVVHE